MDNWELSFEPELLKANIFLKSKNFYLPPKKNVIVKPKEKVIIKLKKNVSVKRKRVILTLREQNISKIKRKRKVYFTHKEHDKIAYHKFYMEFGHTPDEIKVATFYAPRVK